MYRKILLSLSSVAALSLTCLSFAKAAELEQKSDDSSSQSQHEERVVRSARALNAEIKGLKTAVDQGLGSLNERLAAVEAQLAVDSEPEEEAAVASESDEAPAAAAAAQAQAQAPAAQKYKTNKANVNLYASESRESEVVTDKIVKGSSLESTGLESDDPEFVHVQLFKNPGHSAVGDPGFVNLADVNAVDQAEVAAAVDYANKVDLNVRQAPNANSKVLGFVKAGTWLRTVGEQPKVGTWRHVEAVKDAKVVLTGFVNTKHCQKI